MPILENFLFEIDGDQITITASDLDTTFTTSVLAKSETQGKIAINAKLLLESLKTFADTPLSFLVDNQTHQVEISSGDGKYSIAGYNAQEYPKTAQVENAHSITMSAHSFATAINKTIFATGNDDLRPAMNGIFCSFSEDSAIFAATDAHKLVKYTRLDVKSPVNASFILPKKPLNLIKGLLASAESEVRLDYSDKNAFFGFDNFTVICRLIDGKYPNYEAVIPKHNPNKLLIDRALFASAVRRVSIFSNKTTYQVRFKMAGSELTLSAEDFEYNNAATERLTCQYDGQDMEIGFNSKFLLEMLNNIDSEQISLEMSEPNRAGILLPAGDPDPNQNMLMLVMPVMLNV